MGTKVLPSPPTAQPQSVPPSPVPETEVIVEDGETRIVNFDCRHCDQNMEAPLDMVGVLIVCPACNRDIIVPLKPAPGETAISARDVIKEGQAVKPFVPAAMSLKGVGISPPSGSNKQNSSTVRIDLPPEEIVPKAEKRVVIIKRAH